MSDDLHRKLAAKLKQEDGYPGFRQEDWLALDSRLEDFDRRRRRRAMWLWLALPLVALAGLNLYLLLRNDRPASLPNASMEHRTTVVFDTIVKKVTVYEYDTIYRKTYLTGNGAVLPSYFKPAGNGLRNGFDPGPPALDGQQTPAGLTGGPFQSTAAGISLPWPYTADSLDAVDYLVLGPLSFHKKKKKLETSVAYDGARVIRKPLLRKARTAITAGAALPQQAGTNALPGIQAAWENEFALGQEKVWLWESLGWEQLRLQGREHNGIPGFPKPQNPVPDAKLEKVSFESQTLSVKAGLGLQLEPARNISAMIGLGVGGNYRMVSRQTAAYEADYLEDYLRLEFPMRTGWAGFSGHARAGLGWQLGSLWQIRLTGSYGHLFGNALPDGNVRRWWGLNAGVFYRWR